MREGERHTWRIGKRRGTNDAHLIELIDQTHPLVSKHQSPSLQRPLPSDRAPPDICSEPHSRSTLSGGVDGPRSHLLHVLEKLGFGGPWVPTQQNINVPSKLVLLTCKEKKFTESHTTLQGVLPPHPHPSSLPHPTPSPTVMEAIIACVSIDMELQELTICFLPDACRICVIILSVHASIA